MADGAGTDVATRVVDEAAADALGYGQRAVASGTRVARAPGPKAQKKKRGCTAPAHVCRARTVWQTVAGSDKTLLKVRIDDLATFGRRHAKSKPAVGRLAATGFSAWTNAAAEVYVTPRLVQLRDENDKVVGVAPTWLVAVLLRHEAKHVQQFIDNSSKPPASYRAMIGFERDAYRQTAKETRAVRPSTTQQSLRDDMADLFTSVADDFRTRATEPVDERDDKDWLVQQTFLPKHAFGIGHLYVP